MDEPDDRADHRTPCPRRIGTQFVADVRGLGPETLRDVGAMDRLAKALADACGATVLDFRAHGFEPTGGLTALAILSSSHVALHTWPEFGYLAVDLFCCGTDVDTGTVVGVLEDLGGRPTVTSSGFDRPLVPARDGAGF
jgi:S-adenosylmethionine decarboxylase proenzyme